MQVTKKNEKSWILFKHFNLLTENCSYAHLLQFNNCSIISLSSYYYYILSLITENKKKKERIKEKMFLRI